VLGDSCICIELEVAFTVVFLKIFPLLLRDVTKLKVSGKISLSCCKIPKRL